MSPLNTALSVMYGSKLTNRGTAIVGRCKSKVATSLLFVCKLNGLGLLASNHRLLFCHGLRRRLKAMALAPPFSGDVFKTRRGSPVGSRPS